MKLAEWQGDWAVVTGASSGIGREFAEQLAARGINLVLVARRQARLVELAGRLTGTYGVRTRVECIDLSAPGAAEKLRNGLSAQGIRTRLLCNCAGFGRWGHVEQQQIATYEEMIRVNVTATTALSLGFLEDLASHPSSAIVNISSAAALQPVPYMAVYAATKAFVQSFSQALYEEWRERGVHVQTLVPGPTATEFDDIAGAYPSGLRGRASARHVVTESLRKLEDKAPVAFTAPGAFKQQLLAALIPRRLFLREAGKLFHPPSHASK